MTEADIQTVVYFIQTCTIRDSKSWQEYEKGKAIFRDMPLEPEQYTYLIDKLAQWVGV